MERLFRDINFDGAVENSSNKLALLLAFTVKTLRVAGLPKFLNIKWMRGCTPWNFNNVHSVYVASQTVRLKESEASVLLTPHLATVNRYTCTGSGSHSGITEHSRLRGCNSASFCGQLPMFRRNLLFFLERRVVHLTLQDDAQSKLPVMSESCVISGFLVCLHSVNGGCVYTRLCRVSWQVTDPHWLQSVPPPPLKCVLKYSAPVVRLAAAWGKPWIIRVTRLLVGGKLWRKDGRVHVPASFVFLCVTPCGIQSTLPGNLSLLPPRPHKLSLMNTNRLHEEEGN